MILNVDADEAARSARTRSLQQAGYRVLEAASGSECVQLVQAHQPDVVLLNVTLPDMDGRAVRRRIRDLPDRAETPVVHIYDGPAPRGPEADSEADAFLTRPAEAHVLGTLRSMLRMRSAEEQARRNAEDSQVYQRQVIASLPQLVWTSRPDGCCEFISEQWVEYTGVAREQHLGLGWLDAIHPDDRERVWRERSDVLQAERDFDLECRLRGRDGLYRWFVVRGRAIRDQSGRFTGWFGTCTEIEALKQAQKERDELLKSERAARTEAERASRVKDEFVATVSHELRTPMMAMLGWAQLLARRHSVDAELLAEGLDVIERNVRVQAQIIDDLLDVSRMITGKLRLNVQEVDLLPVVHAAIETARPAAEAKDIRLQVNLDAHAAIVAGDPARLQQIFWNILSNAVKFTGKGGRVQVSLQRSGSNVEFKVSDTGEGIRPELLPAIFERFRQADGSSTRRHSGLGLGLAIVRNLVELHGGTVWADSAGEGQGATFTVSLPALSVRRGWGDGWFPRESLLPQAGPAALRGVRVLVVDDDPDARNVVRRVLEDCEASVTTAESGREALEQLRRQRTDVLICDIGMPDQDGYSVIKEVRQMPPEWGGRTPALALTAFARPEDRDRSLQAGFNGHLTKPVQASELVGVVARAAGR